MRFSTQSLLSVYLGNTASSHIVDGKFKRGCGEIMGSAIWICDLRGFTSITTREKERKVVATLDMFFDIVGSCTTSCGGDIIKFMGDSVLVMFQLAKMPIALR